MSKGVSKDFKLLDFWSWHASDLLDNTLRGSLAEFIVAKALGVSVPKESWSAYDIDFKEWRIEVKAAAFVQSWSQKKDSSISFSIRPTREWTPEDGYANEVKRHSDMYVFCLLTEKNKERTDPLVLDQWEFYPVLTSEIDKEFTTQKTVALAALIQRLQPKKCNYESLQDTVTKMLEG